MLSRSILLLSRPPGLSSVRGIAPVGFCLPRPDKNLKAAPPRLKTFMKLAFKAVGAGGGRRASWDLHVFKPSLGHASHGPLPRNVGGFRLESAFLNGNPWRLNPVVMAAVVERFPTMSWSFFPSQGESIIPKKIVHRKLGRKLTAQGPIAPVSGTIVLSSGCWSAEPPFFLLGRSPTVVCLRLFFETPFWQQTSDAGETGGRTGGRHHRTWFLTRSMPTGRAPAAEPVGVSAAQSVVLMIIVPSRLNPAIPFFR